MAEEAEVADKGAILQGLIESVNEISSIATYRAAVKRPYCNLARRLKLLTPLFEEIKEAKETLPEETIGALVSLKEGLASTKELLRFGSEGSKIFLVLERVHIIEKYHEVTAQLERASSAIPLEKLDISDEVKEQVELVRVQFQKAKGRLDPPDVELQEDLFYLYNQSSNSDIDIALLRRLAKKLELMKIDDLTQESLALHEMVCTNGGDPGESIEKISMLLKKIKDFVQTENPMDCASRGRNFLPSTSGQASVW